MAQNNVSERKRKLRKQNKNLPNPNENVPKKVSRDAIKKERAKEREEAAAATAPEPKKRKLAINAMLLKCLLLMSVGVNLLGIVLFEPDTQMHQVLRGIGMMGVPIAVYLTVEGYYNTRSRSRYWAKSDSCSRALPPETSLSAVRWLMQAGKTSTSSPTPAKAQRAKSPRSFQRFFAAA